jgi:hypothetical protein
VLINMENDKVYYYAIYGEIESPIAITAGYCKDYDDIIKFLDNTKYAPKGTKLFYAQISKESYDIANKMFDICERNKYMLNWVNFLFNVITTMINDDSYFQEDTDVAFVNSLKMMNTFVKYDKAIMLMGKDEISDILYNAKIAKRKAKKNSPEDRALGMIIEKYEKRLTLLSSGNCNVFFV